MFETSFDLGNYYTTKQNIEVLKLKTFKVQQLSQICTHMTHEHMSVRPKECVILIPSSNTSQYFQ
jgi:hypothetical protein